MHLIVCDLDSACNHRITDDRLPDIVVDLVKMFYKPALVRALVAVFVLNQGHEIISVKYDRHKRIHLVPLPLILGYRDIAIKIVLLIEQPFVNVY